MALTTQLMPAEDNKQNIIANEDQNQPTLAGNTMTETCKMISINNENKFKSYALSTSITSLVISNFNGQSDAHSSEIHDKYESYCDVFSKMNVIFLSICKDDQNCNWYENYKQVTSFPEFQLYQNGKLLSYISGFDCKALQKKIHEHIPDTMLYHQSKKDSLITFGRDKLPQAAICDELFCKYRAINQCKRCNYYFCDGHIEIDMDHCQDCYQQKNQCEIRCKYFCVVVCVILIPFIVLLIIGVLNQQLGKFMIIYGCYLSFMGCVAFRLYVRQYWRERGGYAGACVTLFR